MNADLLPSRPEIVGEHDLIAEAESNGPATVPKGLSLSANGLRALQQQAALFGEQLGVSRARSLMEVMSRSTSRQVDISTEAADAAVSHSCCGHLPLFLCLKIAWSIGSVSYWAGCHLVGEDTGRAA